MKKRISMFLVLCMLCACGAVCAQPAFQVQVPTVSAKPGERVQTQIVLANNTGILAMLFDLTYDTTRLKLTHVEDCGLVAGAMFGQHLTDMPYKLLWNSASAENFTQDGALVKLEFEVLADAPAGLAEIRLAYAQENVFDVNLKDVPIQVVNGGVEVVAEKQPAHTPTTVIRPSAGGASGGSASVWPQTKPEADVRQRQMILTIGKCEALVFGRTKTNDVAPKIVNGRTMLPARFVAEALGATVHWTADAPQQVDIRKADTQILLYIGSDAAYINGEKCTLDSPAFLENDRTYTPIRFIAEALGATVAWDENTQKVTITAK